jgi:hypothetical protein
MLEAKAKEIVSIVNSAYGKLKAVGANEAKHKDSPNKWSKVEILGHLIDSASNNHQRFVRVQQTDKLVSPPYQQNEWVSSQYYNNCNWSELIEFWRLYNFHLSHIIKHFPMDKLETPCIIGNNDAKSLYVILDEYISHLNHHLSQIVEL